jgi:medium-chain acyl-[acyl-carrier-protein] hydrolase
VPRNVLSPSLRLLSPSTGTRAPLRLFAFPYAGAGAYTYRPWAALLPDHVELLGIQLPGREDRSHTVPLDDLPTVLGGLSAEITAVCEDGADWAVFGHSLGAVLACAVVRSLTTTHGEAPPRHVLVSGCRALHLVHRNRRPVHDLSDSELIKHIRSLNGTPEEILADSTIMGVLLRLIRADYSLFDQYHYSSGTLLMSPITVFAGDADPSTSPDTVEPWEQLTTSTCEVHTLSGDHFFVNQSRDLLVRLVSRVLDPEAP